MIEEFRELPCFDPWMKDNRDLLKTCRDVINFGKDDTHHASRFQDLHHSVRSEGYLVERYPLIRGSRVRDGNHRIAYCITRGFPCLVDYEM